MRKPNGYGSIKHLSGRRRRPFVFVVSKEGRQRPSLLFCTTAYRLSVVLRLMRYLLEC